MCRWGFECNTEAGYTEKEAMPCMNASTEVQCDLWCRTELNELAKQHTKVRTHLYICPGDPDQLLERQ